jgi:hypothetical protein
MSDAYDVKSALATALYALVVGSRIFDFSEWADRLGVTQEEIRRWLNDASAPSPEMLAVIIAYVDESGDPNRSMIDFETILSWPIAEASPRLFPANYSASIRAYLLGANRKAVRELCATAEGFERGHRIATHGMTVLDRCASMSLCAS